MDKNPSQLELATRQHSAIALAIACLLGAGTVGAQTAEPAKPASAPAAAQAPEVKKDAETNKDEAAKTGSTSSANPAVTAELDSVLIIGARMSQRSSIDRKKHAATATDSIIAEDVGAFPDRNIGEAISRIAGVALDRGDFGEGTSVSVRGNGAELTRVELDGQAVQAGGGTNLLGGGDGRGVEFRELSSDLIKSVDVVKGSTADMTEGSLGGGIIITTRNGLDFKKPYYSIRVAGTESSLNQKVTPNLNLVLADKFLDSRLGVLLNLNKAEYSNESHHITNGGSNNVQGLVRLFDFDNSPNKTFSFNPSTLSKTDATVNVPFLVSPLTAGGNFNSASPMELLTKSAAAGSKAACNTAFPALTTAQRGAINGGTNQTNAVNQRSNELLTCLNQWSDYTPSLIRSYVKTQEDKREGGDLRLDFKVNDQLSIYGKYSNNKRQVDDVVGNFSVGGNPVLNPAGSFVDSASGVRSVAPGAPGAGYYLFDSTASFRNNLVPAIGATANIKPGYTVDDSHHVTSYTTTDSFYNTDMIFSKVETSATYGQVGGEYVNGDLRAQFMIGDAKSTFDRYDRRAAFGYKFGEGTFAVQPDGAWTFALPPGSTNDQLNYAKYAELSPQLASAAIPISATNTVAVPAYTAAQKPLLTQTTGLQVIRALKSISDEKTAKADFTYALRERVPFLTSVKTGFNLRKTTGDYWGNGGGNVQDQVGTFGQPGYIAAISLPTLNQRSSVVGCENTPGSLAAGGQPCVYGYAPTTNPATPQNGQTVLTQAQYLDLVKQVLSVAPASQFFGGAANRPADLINGWTQLDIEKLYKIAGIVPNLDCIVECKASDGKVYAQPVTRFSEKVTAGYLMGDFDIDRVPFTDSALPFGMELQGNIGARVVRTEVKGTGFLAFTSIRKTAAYDPANPANTAGFSSITVRKNTEMQDTTTDVLPSLNLALWAVPNQLVLRYNIAKTIARPPVAKLLPSGTCTYDERITDNPNDPDGSQADQRCSGTMGNPALKPYTNTNQNLSAEWFANRDTMFSAAVFKQKGTVGAPNLIAPRNGIKVFAGSNVVDPVTGAALSDMEFSYNEWDNQQPTVNKGVELGMKTAFTFLPSVLRFTGLDANYTQIKSNQAVPTLDLITGDTLPVLGQPKYSYNASLWYDDGGFSARLALQVVAERYTCFSPCSTTSGLNVNNYPAEGIVNWRLPYNPGAPIYTNRTSFLDGKMAYKFKNGVEIFVEGRNLTGERTQSSTGGYQDYSNGVPSLYSDNYNGRRYMVGVNIRSPQ